MNTKMRDTKQRDAIRSALKNAGNRILSPMEILAIAQKDIPNLGIATVYRNIKGMVINREITPVTLPGMADRYTIEALPSVTAIFINRDGYATVNDPNAYYDPSKKFSKRTYFIEE